MLITCPYCSTGYNLPDEKVNDSLKLRCTVCKKVFGIDEATPSSKRAEVRIGSESAQKKAAPKKTTKLGKILLIVIAFFAVLGGVLFALWTFTGILDDYKPYVNEVLFFSDEQIQENRMLEQVRMLELQDMRQYTTDSEKVGEIAIIEGKILNNFPEARANILVEVSLYDEKGQILETKTQLAGTVVSLFQLQVYDQTELETALADQKLIQEKNSNVVNGANVPFMVLFYNPPVEASSFGVKIIEATIIPTEAEEEEKE